ncbi:Fe-S-cluster containining protein [Azospirillum fermentarium]|uniref:YkgJ family cysteine cluster protein n=1 Tax=Azospirillum fermentarium TaxID=1233114 RepID=UPI002225B779|nr:YkgJ family cysteine cluster protein [Azospirillum fermentarium]MCW2247860.1 Fe-S-cluster containining protein [Azospirillum fermentarium]
MATSKSVLPKLPPIPPELVDAANALVPYLNDASRTLGEKLAAIYAYLDRFAPFVRTFATCSMGCAHCCKIDVQITTLEAEYIQMMTGVPYRPGAGLSTGHKDACPFLAKDRGCGIYRHRPLACRIYHAVGDPEDCKPGRIQMQYGGPPDHGNPIYASYVRWLHFTMAEIGGTVRDIRDFFPCRA